MVKCRKCNSYNIEVNKYIHKAIKGGKDSFHYKISCRDCKSSYHTERTREIYEMVKDKQWLLSTAARKRAKKKRDILKSFEKKPRSFETWEDREQDKKLQMLKLREKGKRHLC